MTIKTHVSQTEFQENTYILVKNNDVLIIDPGDKLENIVPYIGAEEKVIAVLATHGHLDHISSVSNLCKKYACPFIMSAKDQDVLDHHKSSCDMFRQTYYGTPKIDIDISTKSKLELNSFYIKILHTPGHTKGGVSFLIDQALFSGDTLFYRSIGHVNQYGGNPDTLINSIKEQLFILPDETIVYPGHMRTTTIGEEKKFNPFIIL